MITSRTRLVRAAGGSIAGSGLVGLLGLLGHVLDVRALDGLVPGLARMQPLAATGILLVAASLGLQLEPLAPARRSVARTLAAAALILGVAVLVEYGAGIDLGIDWYLTRTAVAHPGRPSPLAAASLVALGSASLLLDVRAGRLGSPREWMCLPAALCSFIGLVGHLFGAGALYELGGEQVTGVALPTGVALSLLVIGALLARPDEGVTRVVLSRGPGGVLLRRLGLAALISGPLLGGLVLSIVEATVLEDLPLIIAISDVLTVFFGLALLVATALSIDRAYAVAARNAERTHELFQHAPEGILIADPEGHYVDVNVAAVELLGFSRRELLERGIVDVLPADDMQRLHAALQRMREGATEVGGWRLRRKDGTLVPAEVSAKILPDGRFQAFVRDVSVRVALERQLVESRDFLQTVLESSTAYAIVAEDLEGRVILWNAGAHRIFGHAAGDVQGTPAAALAAAGEEAVWSELHADAVARGTAERNIVARREDGEVFAASVVCTRRLGADGATVGVLLVIRDLTVEQRALAEQELLARVGVELASCLEVGEVLERLVALATRYLGDLAVIDLARDGGLRRSRVGQAPHLEPGVAEAVLALGAVHGDAHPLRRVLATRQPVRLERIDPITRRSFAVSPAHEAILDRVGATSAMILPLVARDQLQAVLSISACRGSRTYTDEDLRVAMEVARRGALALDNAHLYQQSRLQAAMTAHLAEGVVLIRAADATIVYANQTFERMFGYGPGELVGRPVAALNAGDGTAIAAGIIEALRASGTWHGELENVRKDGSSFWCAASVSSFDHEEHGAVWIAVHTDVTERRLLEQKNELALREKEVLLKEIHHRVKNNLQVVSSLFSLQRERTESAALRTLLDESRARVQSIALVHEQLYRSADLAVIDLDEYLRALVAALRDSYGAQRVVFHVAAQGVQLDVEQAVPCALIVCELVTNSLKHAFKEHAGRVEVTARTVPGPRCVLEVADDGEGIPEGVDWRASRSLGLRLVQSLARQLRAEVEVERSGGTRFRLDFALRKAASTQGPDHSQSRSASVRE